MKNALFLLLSLISAAAMAGPRTGHHGDWIVTCHPPKFIQEKPVKDSQVPSFQEFEFIASQNTDAQTLKVWVNNKLLDVYIYSTSKRLLPHCRQVARTLVGGKSVDKSDLRKQ